MTSVVSIAKRTSHLVGLVFVAGGLGLLLAVGLGPRVFGYRTLTVLTGSMRPHLAPGTVVFETAKPLPSLRVGDVITYQIPVEDHRVVTHRVFEILDAGLHPVVRTKGDANPDPDPWTAELTGARAWHVRAAVPWVGSAIARLRTARPARAGVLVLPALLALVWLWDIWAPKTPSPSSETGVACEPRRSEPTRRGLVIVVAMVAGALVAERAWRSASARS
jgi:signal peptidase